MAHRIVKEVTQPVIGADGNSVVFAPGEQFPVDHELPEGVPWKLVIAGAPDEPVAAALVAAAAVEPAAPAAPAAAATSRPLVNAPKADWVEYAVSAGAERGSAEAMSKADLVTAFGGRAAAPQA